VTLVSGVFYNPFFLFGIIHDNMTIIFKLLGIGLGAFVIALSGAMMPGPLLTVTISESMDRGKWAGSFLIIGHAILELCLIIVLLCGFSSLFQINRVIGTISLLGGIILLWMGWDTILKAKRLSLSFSQKKSTRSSFGPVIIGIFASISNPYWTIWWATIGIGYMAASLVYGFWGILVFFIGHISADFAWYTIVSFSVAGGKNFISDSIYHRVLVACGGILWVFGIIFLFVGFKKFAF